MTLPPKRRGRPPKVKAQVAPLEHGRTGAIPPELDPDAEVEERIDDGMLVDRGDGVRVVRRSYQHHEDSDTDECPDEPPPGWGDG